MVEPLIQKATTPALLLSCALSLSGCLDVDDGIRHDDDRFVRRTYTAWQPLPSKDGTRLAFALEPRRVDASSRGVVIEGWRGQVAGDGIVVVGTEPEPRAPLGILPRGFLDTDWDADTLFAWTKAAFEWTPVAPNDMPPAVPYATVTMLDRSSFAPKGTRSFDPPLLAPIAVGGGFVLDTPLQGTSDVERPLHITLHDLLGESPPVVLHEGRGTTSSTCARGAALTVVYRAAKNATVVIDVIVNNGKPTVARRDLEDFAADGILCRANGSHIALVGGRPSDRAGRVYVLERAEDALLPTFENSVKLPAVLSRDGSTLLAAGPNDEALLVTRGGAKVLDGVPRLMPGRVAYSGDRVFVSGDKQSATVQLDGASPIVRPVPVVEDGARHAMMPLGSGSFLVFETKYEAARYADAIVRAAVRDEADGEAVLSLSTHHDPKLAWADERRAFLVAGRRVGTEDETIELIEIDLMTKAVSRIQPFPLCDRSATLTSGRCRP